MQTIVIERDVDQDRFISYDRFKTLLKEWATLSKQQDQLPGCHHLILWVVGYNSRVEKDLNRI